MKKKSLFGFAACIVVAVIVAITLNLSFSTNSSDLSDIALVNVEALANNEVSCGCYGPKMSDSNGIYCECRNDMCCKDLHGCN